MSADLYAGRTHIASTSMVGESSAVSWPPSIVRGDATSTVFGDDDTRDVRDQTRDNAIARVLIEAGVLDGTGPR